MSKSAWAGPGLLAIQSQAFPSPGLCVPLGYIRHPPLPCPLALGEDQAACACSEGLATGPQWCHLPALQRLMENWLNEEGDWGSIC